MPQGGKKERSITMDMYVSVELHLRNWNLSSTRVILQYPFIRTLGAPRVKKKERVHSNAATAAIAGSAPAAATAATAGYAVAADTVDHSRSTG